MLKVTDVSEKHFASILKVEKLREARNKSEAGSK
jgi:hypothetical protein